MKSLPIFSLILVSFFFITPTFAQKEAAFFSNAEIAQVDDTGHEMIYFQWEQVYPIVLTYLDTL